MIAYKKRITPVVHGNVVQISADRLSNSKSNTSYLMVVQLDKEELAALPDIRLYPRTPATVIIPPWKLGQHSIISWIPS